MEATDHLSEPDYFPRNSEAERELLGCLMLNNDIMSRIQDFLLPEHFFEPVHERIFTAIRSMFTEGETANPVTMKRRFDEDERLKQVGGAQYLVQLAAGASMTTNAKEYAQEIYRCWQNRELIGWCRVAIHQASTESGKSPDEIGAGLSGHLNDMAQTDSRRRIITGGALAEEILSELGEDVTAFTTGLERLDKAMGGGMYAGYTYGFGGRKKTGKTVLAGTLAYNLDRAGVKHLFICGEMGAKQIHKRLLARHAGTSDYAFRLRNMQTPDFQNSIADYSANHGQNILFQNAPGLTFDDLKRYMSRAVYRDKVQGVILDYWQLVGGKHPRDSEAKHLDIVAQWIADFSREHEIWSVVFSQMNQEGNTRGGEGLRNACDQFYEIHRPNTDEPGVWFEMKETRYTEWRDVGKEHDPAFDLDKIGPHFSERAGGETRYSFAE